MPVYLHFCPFPYMAGKSALFMAIVTIDGIPVYSAIIGDGESGMFRISLVDDPAVQSNFLAFDKVEKVPLYCVKDEEKRLVIGVVMRADFPIYRRDDRLGEFYIIYKADAIREMAEKYLAEGRQNNVNLMHAGPEVEGVQLVQYFIKDTAKGISPAGFEEIADGSLFAEFHVTNDEVWQGIKGGTFKGFSLEGVFDLEPERDVDGVQEIVDTLHGFFKRIFKPSKNTDMTKFERIKAALAKVLCTMGSITTDKGVLSWEGDEDLKAGDKVTVLDEEGNPQPAADGEYTTADGKTIVVVDGEVSEIHDPEAEVETEFGRVNTDKGELLWNHEEELKEGDEVFQEVEGLALPAEDGDYVTEDGKTIRVSEGKVAEIIDNEAEVAPEPTAEVEELRRENAALKAQVERLTAAVAKLSRKPLAKPAHQVVRQSEQVSVQKTGVAGLDNIARKMFGE